MSIKKSKGKNVLNLQKEKSKRTITIPDESAQSLPFTAIPNEIIDDTNIIPRAKLLMVYLLKHASIQGWQYHDLAMQNFLGCGRDNLEAAFKSLRQAGYVTNVILFTNKGKICGSKRIFARTSKFLELNKSKLKLVPKSSNTAPAIGALDFRASDNTTRCPEIQGTENKGTINQGILKKQTIKNKNLKNNKTNPRSVQTRITHQKPFEPDHADVVSLSEKVQQWAIAETLVRSWLKRHSAEYLLEKIEYTKVHSTINPAGFLRKAIENNYQKHLANDPKLEQKVAIEIRYPSHEENIAWYADLSDNEKQGCLNQAKHRHAHFEEMLKIEKVDFKSVGFLKTTWFKMMMQLLGRAK